MINILLFSFLAGVLLMSLIIVSVCYHTLKQWANEDEEFKKISTKVNALIETGTTYKNMGEFDLAMEYFEEAEKLNKEQLKRIESKKGQL